MILDEKQILKTIELVKKGFEHKETLKELLGGERLDDIFDSGTQQAIFDNIVNNGKVHNMMPNGNGLDILDGLLNNKIRGNLSDFYMIKPDYILQLSPEQQINMADSISGGKYDLSLALQTLWSKGIRTEACTTKSSDNIPMLQLIIKENEIIKQYIVQQLYEQSDINGTAFYDYQSKEFIINLAGNNLYKYLQEGNIPISQIKKANIFEGAIKDSLQFAEEMYISYSRNGIDTTELREEILSKRRSLKEINSRTKSVKKQSQMTRQEQSNNTFQNPNAEAKLPVRQNKFLRFLSQVLARFSRQNRNNAIQKAATSTDNLPKNEYTENPKGKKSLELEPEEKARIQKETAEIAKRFREQEEQQKQAPAQKLQQSDYTQMQQQIPPQQPPIDMGGMEL